MQRAITLLILYLIISFQVRAQQDGSSDGADNGFGQIVTDRPDATEASRVVPKGAFQIETGGFYQTFEDEGITTDSYTFNTTLLRYGLLENFELRLGWDFVEERTKVESTGMEMIASGMSPLLAGMKVQIADEDGWIPELALIGHVFLPFTAGSDFRPETTGADFRFSGSYTIDEASGFGYNVGAQWGDDSPEIAYIYTMVYGRSITHNTGFYVELYGDFPEDSKANHLWDAGVTWLPIPNLQFDATVGTSITEGQDLLLSAGLSYRIPK